MTYAHIPVLLLEVVDALQVSSGDTVIDCTFGGGGYSIALAEKGVNVYGIDLDRDSIRNFEMRADLSQDLRSRIHPLHGNFDSVQEIAAQLNLTDIHGIVFDLGVSSYQLDSPEKGFSFLKPGPLDMRMDPTVGLSAGKLIDVLDEDSLTSLFIKYSDEIHARRIAKGIVQKRQEIPWEHRLTTELADFIEKELRIPRERIHPATKVFQALRMAVNDEYGNLHRGLRGAFEVLRNRGRIVVVSFHSIEDRIVKQFMQEYSSEGKGKIIGDMIISSENEVKKNIRSRSAKMRVLEKL